MAASLTLQQIAILRRVDAGLGLPAYVLRPKNCASDVELLRFFRLIASDRGGLSIEPAGADYLARLDSEALAGSDEGLVNLRVAHGRDHSISVERWPQEA